MNDIWSIQSTQGSRPVVGGTTTPSRIVSSEALFLDLLLIHKMICMLESISSAPLTKTGHRA